MPDLFPEGLRALEEQDQPYGDDDGEADISGEAGEGGEES